MYPRGACPLFRGPPFFEVFAHPTPISIQEKRINNMGIRPGLVVAVLLVLALTLCGTFVYRRLTQAPPEILEYVKNHPTQPKPEIVASGISLPLAFLLLTVSIVVIAMVGWHAQRTQ